MNPRGEITKIRIIKNVRKMYLRNRSLYGYGPDNYAEVVEPYTIETYYDSGDMVTQHSLTIDIETVVHE